MKIVCHHCQAAYQVEIPGLKTKDVEVKCARCKSKFVVKKHGSDVEADSPAELVEALAGGIASESQSEETPPEARMEKSSIPEQESAAENSSDLDFEDDNKLDDYLDKILEEELGSPDPKAIKTQNLSDTDSNIAEVDKDLDSLLNDLIDEGLQSDMGNFSEEPVEEQPAPEGDESYSEDLLEDIMSEEQQEAEPSTEAKTEKPVEENIDADLETESSNPPEALNLDHEESVETPEQSTTQEETPETSEKSDEDLWAEAFADQATVKQFAEKEEAPAEPNTAEKETPEASEKSDEDLWAEAFADQEATEQKAEKTDDENVTMSAEEEPPADATFANEEKPEMVEVANDVAEKSDDAFDNMDDDDDQGDDDYMAEGLNEEEELPEDAFSDDYDESEFEFKPKKRLFSTPKTRTGKVIMAGSILAVLLTAGGVYFTLQTFAPAELVDLDKAENVVPEGLTPNETGETPPNPEQNPQENAPGEENYPTPESIGPASTIEQELAQSKKLQISNATIKNVSELNQIDALQAALSPRSDTVTIQTIMPVAYNINDIRVLSFNLEVVMDDEKTADVIREALPVFERLTLEGVEELLNKKFYNDVLYVKEKLQKKFRKDINAKLEGGGRVKKVKFKEFSIQ